MTPEESIEAVAGAYHDALLDLLRLVPDSERPLAGCIVDWLNKRLIEIKARTPGMHLVDEAGALRAAIQATETAET